MDSTTAQSSLDGFNLADLFGIGLNPTPGAAPTPAPAPSEEGEQLDKAFSETPDLREVPTSPGAVPLGSGEFDEDAFCENIGLENIWGGAPEGLAGYGPEGFHPEVVGDIAAVSCSSSSTGPLRLGSGNAAAAMAVLKEELQGDYGFSSPAPTQQPGQQDPNQPQPQPQMIQIEGYSVTVAPKGKPLYCSPEDRDDHAVQRLFPEWTLRLERNLFNKWKKKNGVRKLTAAENDRLKRYRRTMLARVYADRARHRRAGKHSHAEALAVQLQSENATLRARVAELEAQVTGR